MSLQLKYQRMPVSIAYTIFPAREIYANLARQLPSEYHTMFVVVAPGILLVCVAVAAGVPAYVTLRESGRGRARSAVAYLGGFFTGIATTTLLFVLLPAVVTASTPDIGSIGLAGSFWGPFLGMARAKWVRPQSKPAHRLRPTRIDRVR